MASGSLFAGLFAHGEAAARVDDRALVESMVEFEVALLQVLADLDLAPVEAARELADAVAGGKVELDLEELGRATGEQGTPVPGLLRAFRRVIAGRKPDNEIRRHRGACTGAITANGSLPYRGRVH